MNTQKIQIALKAIEMIFQERYKILCGLYGPFIITYRLYSDGSYDIFCEVLNCNEPHDFLTIEARELFKKLIEE